ncbi:hypothetical protein Tco_0146044 [Tanacetum coccineum]
MCHVSQDQSNCCRLPVWLLRVSELSVRSSRSVRAWGEKGGLPWLFVNGENEREKEKDIQRMIPEPGDQDREVRVAETFHEQTDEELSEKEVKQVEADDHAIQTILLGLPEDIYAAVDSCETA